MVLAVPSNSPWLQATDRPCRGGFEYGVTQVTHSGVRFGDGTVTVSLGRQTAALLPSSRRDAAVAGDRPSSR
ncbi:MAG: hypothetical protein R2695_04715 [Acidimicrobiales bacterium]